MSMARGYKDILTLFTCIILSLNNRLYSEVFNETQSECLVQTNRYISGVARRLFWVPTLSAAECSTATKSGKTISWRYAQLVREKRFANFTQSTHNIVMDRLMFNVWRISSETRLITLLRGTHGFSVALWRTVVSAIFAGCSFRDYSQTGLGSSVSMCVAICQWP